MAIDEHSAAAIAEQHQMMVDRAAETDLTLVGDPFLFSDALDGSRPWRPGAINLFFRRLRQRVELDHLIFHTLRKFMETYGQDLGFSPVQVAIRA